MFQDETRANPRTARGGRKHTHTGPIATSDWDPYNAMAPWPSNKFDKNPTGQHRTTSTASAGLFAIQSSEFDQGYGR